MNNYQIRITGAKIITVNNNEYISEIRWEKIGQDENGNFGMATGDAIVPAEPILKSATSNAAILQLVQDSITNDEELIALIDEQIESSKTKPIIQYGLDFDPPVIPEPVEPHVPTAEEIAAQLVELKSIKKDHVRSMLREKLDGGAVYNGKTFATDTYSLILLQGAVTLASSGNWPANGEFKLDGVLQTVTAADILGMFEVVQNHVITCYNREKALVESIEAFTSVDELSAYELVW